VAFFAGDKTLAVLSMELALEFLCRMLLRGTENVFLEPFFNLNRDSSGQAFGNAEKEAFFAGRVNANIRTKEINAWKATIIHLGAKNARIPSFFAVFSS